MKKIIPELNGWMLVALACLFTVIYQLLVPGMFFDGLTYASISENYVYAQSFWEMHYTETLKLDFYEHPPLSFFLQSIFLRIGLNEEIYSLFMLLLSFYLMSRIYTLCFGHKSLRWFPSLFFVLTPIVFWSFSNNMLENTLTVFVLLNLWMILFFYKKQLANYWFVIPGAITFLCFLIKGPIGLFPFMFLPFYWFFIEEKRDFKNHLKKYFYYLGGFFTIFCFILINDNAREFFAHYLDQQILSSIRGDRETAPFRLFIFTQLILELLVMAGVVCLLYFAKLTQKPNRYFYFFIAIGFSASLPLLVSAKQMGFYLVPSMAFFALAFAGLLYDKISNYFRSLSLFFILLIGLFITAPTVLFNSLQDIRDKDEQELVSFFSLTIYYTNEKVSISQELSNDWALHAYLYRYCQISLDDKNNYKYKIISAKEIPLQDLPVKFSNDKYIVYVMK